ncbi:MAG: winged helix-turn-helix domain-containing protein [Chloroflexia bacterium]
MSELRTISPTLARRIAVARQRLGGPDAPAVSRPDAERILEVVRDLGCLQLDPTSAVARSHLLVLWSRLGPYDPVELDKLLWRERSLFEYWAHAASIVLTEDYPIHSVMMRRYASGESGWSRTVRDWMEGNRVLRDHILEEIGKNGPMQSKQFEDKTVESWQSTGWTGGRNVSRMLDFLWTQGRIMVAGRVGGQRLWDLAERCLPEGTLREEIDRHEAVRRAAQKSLRALGVGTAKDISQHYTRGRYPGLEDALAELEAGGRIEQVRVVEEGRGVWPGIWYVHTDDLPLLERLAAGEWQPRTTLLSPFDNLICDRARTERLFGFDFRIEIYVPKAQRKYGYYVLPILHGDRLIGRIDPSMDRKQKRLTVNAIYAEPHAPTDAATGQAIAGAIESLGEFLGPEEIVYGERVPEGWGSAIAREEAA